MQNQISRLKNLIKIQTNNSLGQYIQFSDSLYPTFIYETEDKYKYSSKPYTLFDKVISKVGKKAGFELFSDKNAFQLSKLKNISDDDYTHNCTSSLLSIFPNLIECNFPIITPALTQPKLKNVKKKNYEKIFLSKISSNKFDKLNNQHINNFNKLKLKFNNVEYNNNLELENFKKIFINLENFKRLFKNIHNTLKKNKQLNIPSSNISKIDNIGKFIYNFKIDYLTKGENKNKIKTLFNNLNYIKNFLISFIIKYKNKNIKFNKNIKIDTFVKLTNELIDDIKNNFNNIIKINL